MKIVAHIFPSYKDAYAHLKHIWDRDDVLEVNKTKVSYTERNGTLNKCFVVKSRDDVGVFLAFEFASTVTYGTFPELSREDFNYLTSMLSMRTRHVPEVA